MFVWNETIFSNLLIFQSACSDKTVVMYYTPGHFFEKSVTGVYYITTRHLMEKYVLENMFWKIYFGSICIFHIVLPYGV